MRRERFGRVALGGPQETVARLRDMLVPEVRARLLPERIEVDLSAANEEQVREAVRRLARQDARRVERDALRRLEAAGAPNAHAATGVDDTLAALNERRVQTLVLAAGFDREGARCPACGLLSARAEGSRPADGAGLEAVGHLREAALEAALRQDAGVLVVTQDEERPPRGGDRGAPALLRDRYRGRAAPNISGSRTASSSGPRKVPRPCRTTAAGSSRPAPIRRKSTSVSVSVSRASGQAPRRARARSPATSIRHTMGGALVARRASS